MHSHRLLVVDDDDAVRSLICATLRDEGYEVTGAGDGHEALALLDHHRFDAIVLDMRMPGLDGWGLALELRLQGLALPTVAVTGYTDARRWAEEIKADCYLRKPFEHEELLAAVRAALERARPDDASPAVEAA
jgi:DNA-binding response OmpR family regulator